MLEHYLIIMGQLGFVLSLLPDWYYSANLLSYASAEYCEKYAKPEDAGITPEDKSSDEELSEEEDDSADEAILGNPDP